MKTKKKPAPPQSRPSPKTPATDQHHPTGCTHFIGSGERVRCSRCDRVLTARASVRRGLGPVCMLAVAS
jgi:hypothetical protein